MNIIIANNQKNFKITKEIRNTIKKSIMFCISYINFRTDVEVAVTIVDNKEISELNAAYRKVDKPTDVLSFPMLTYDEYKNVIDEDLKNSYYLLLGDIVLSIEKAKEQADQCDGNLQHEIAFLIVHSMLHLIGYDHQDAKHEAEMFSLQDKILFEMGI